jgi:DNA-binding NtrC family response regulator
MALLESHAWPGNVRELENVIQRAIIIAQQDHIGVEDLPAAIAERGLKVVNPEAGCFERQVRQYKTKLAYTAIQECNGNKTLAARNLNISRAYLHRLIRAEEPDAEAV